MDGKGDACPTLPNPLLKGLLQFLFKAKFLARAGIVLNFSLANRCEARKHGLLRKHSSETSPDSGREGETLTALPVEGTT